jgi:hypothetical protein
MTNIDDPIEQILAALKECIADPDFVGSAHGNEAYRAAHKWLDSHKASSTDSFYQEVQVAVVKYAEIEKVLAMGDE